MRFFIFLLATLLLPAFAWTQKKSIHAPEVVEGTKNMYQGPKNSFSITMPDADDKVVEDLWNDLIKNYDSKLKRVRKADVEMAENVRIQSISGTGTINLYSIIDEQGDDVVLSVWFEMDNGNFLSSAAYPNSYADVEELLQNFGISVKRKMVEIELDEEKEMLEDLAKDLEKMVKQKEKTGRRH
jgi:coenzyme F420-reducing hydrogenase delta subunit